MTMEQRPVGIFIAALGAVGIVVSALADPLGLGEGHVFGWLQITGVVLGAVVLLLGLALAMEWMPYPGEQRATTTSGAQQNTTIVGDSTPSSRPTP
jgi:hypothetical protein